MFNSIESKTEVYMNNQINQELKTIPCKNDLLNKEYIVMLLSQDFLNKLYKSKLFKYENNILGPAGKKYIDRYILNKYCLTYVDKIKNIINELNSREFFEQKSIRWHLERQTMLTATDSEKIDSDSQSQFYEVCLKKLKEIEAQPPSNSPALVHGNTYEDVALKLYESRYNVIVKEYTILRSKTHQHIGASPDGIVNKVDPYDYNSYSRYGRLLEIKNPFSRIIDGTIKPCYYAQMQQQMFVTGLPLCDFLECDIKDIRCTTKSSSCYDDQYENIHDMLEDTIDTSIDGWKNKIENPNVPWQNLNKYGREKGVIIVFNKIIKVEHNGKSFEENIQKVELYPLHIIYKYEDIIDWLNNIKKKYRNDGYNVSSILNWKLYKFNIITVHYDQIKFETERLPKLNEAWKKICSYKEKYTYDQLNTLFDEEKKKNAETKKNKRSNKKLTKELDIPDKPNNIYDIYEQEYAYTSDGTRINIKETRQTTSIIETNNNGNKQVNNNYYKCKFEIDMDSSLFN
jgi:hypothetical protein